MDQYRLGFIGFGHMAQIIFSAFRVAHFFPNSHVQFVQRDRKKMKEHEQKYHITATSLEHLVSSSDVVLLCVRPGQLPQVAKDIASCTGKVSQVISILAGVPISLLQGVFGEKVQVARAMPNVASAVGAGMTTLSFSLESSLEFRSFVQQLMAPLGHSIELPESQMDIATAIAGSGPGFVFQLIQATVDAAVKGGLSSQQALLMAAHTFLGASRLVAEKGDIASLLEQIATPGGVTEAGLEAMERLEIGKHFQHVIDTARQKASGLSKAF